MKPLSEKLSSVQDLCSTLKDEIADLKRDDVSRIKTNLDQMKKMLDRPIPAPAPVKPNIVKVDVEPEV